MVSRFRQWLRRLSASPVGSEAIAEGDRGDSNWDAGRQRTGQRADECHHHR